MNHAEEAEVCACVGKTLLNIARCVDLTMINSRTVYASERIESTRVQLLTSLLGCRRSK